MYSVVLATMLSVGGGTTGHGHHHHGVLGIFHHHGVGHFFGHGHGWGHGCHGCNGCWGCNGCFGCSGCWGCNGCRGWGCNGCFGCSGCWGCNGCHGFGCNGCWGGNGWGCNGCIGCSGCVGCVGCCGGVILNGGAAPAPAAPVPPPPGNGYSAPVNTPAYVNSTPATLRTAAAPAKSAPAQQEVSLAPQVARITVNLPSDARLWVDNMVCPLTSDVRSFNTPTLEPGRQYFYTLKVEVDRNGQTLTQNRRVYVAGGQQINVDFTAINTATAQR